MSRFRHLRTGLLGSLVLVALAACDLIESIGEKDKVPLPGERVSILALEPQLAPDPEIQDVSVRLPPPYANADWPQAGGSANHAMYHLAAPPVLRPVWSAEIGDGSDDEARIVSPPIVAGGLVFAMDAGGVISALDAGTGARRWEFDTRPEEDEGGFGGGIAHSGKRLFAATGYGDVFALEPATGKVIWHRPLLVPIRAAPVVSGTRVFLVSYDNQTFALDGRDGELLWSHAGIAEPARLLGAATPAVERDVVVVPYSSGELYALRVESGRVAWSEALSAPQFGAESLANLNTINCSPVIDRGIVFAVSHGGRLAALDLSSGNRVWEQTLSGQNMPWPAGEFVYVVTADAEVLCLSRERGRIRCVEPLPRFEDADRREGPISWSGPILLSDRLILVSSNGVAVALSPYDGHILGQSGLPAGVRVPPIAAGGTVYVLTDTAEIVALR